MKKPYILCAAIWYNRARDLPDNLVPTYSHQPRNISHGIVVCGRRHHNCYIVGVQIPWVRDSYDDGVSGFLTSDDRFVNRREAGIIAFEAGQTKSKITHLLSEHIY